MTKTTSNRTSHSWKAATVLRVIVAIGGVTLGVGGLTLINIENFFSLRISPEPITQEPRPVVGLPPPTPAETAQAEAMIAQQIENCIAEEEARVEFSRAFSVRGGARCPGGGCLFRSSSCNRATRWVSYEAPAPYYVNEYRTEDHAMNDGDISNLQITAQDAEGRALGVRVLLTCDPPDHPGAGGGWARATLAGIERLRDEEEVRENIRTECENQVTSQ